MLSVGNYCLHDIYDDQELLHRCHHLAFKFALRDILTQTCQTAVGLHFGALSAVL